MYVMDIAPTNVSRNFDNKELRYKMDCYILHTLLLVIILQFTRIYFIIAVVCYHYTKHRSKLKRNVLPY